jgi:hypothetical protein
MMTKWPAVLAGFSRLKGMSYGMSYGFSTMIVSTAIP